MINEIKLSGYKSIKEMALELSNLNVLIGANGAGKSNLINFFKMINHIMSGNLQQYIATTGYADALLYYGAKITPQITATFHFDTQAGKNTYHIRLVNAAQDTLIFADEAIAFLKNNTEGKARLVSIGAGHPESYLLNNTINTGMENLNYNRKTARVIKNIMQQWRVYHFNDTSGEAKIKKQGYINDNNYLRHDGGNLAAFLYQMQQNDEKYYKRIITTLKTVVPFFDDFVLHPSALNTDYIILNWKEKKTYPDMVFGPNQLSDGTIRFVALATLLLQPHLPELIIIDEPELGLHPFAISILAGLLKSVSYKTQIIVSTQSVSLIDNLEPEHIIVVDRENDQSIFKRLNEKDLEIWLREYSIGELWEKNVFGGRP